MTDQKDLKRRVRERMTKTGESYTTARRRVLAQGLTSSPLVAIEPVDFTAEAHRLELRCQVRVFPGLLARVDGTRLLERVRDALRATEGEEATQLLREAAFRGQLPPEPSWRTTRGIEELQIFLKLAVAGIGGIGAGGFLLALQIDDVTVLCHLTASPDRTTPEPALWLSTPDDRFGLRVAPWPP